PLAAGTVMPGMHAGAAASALPQTVPMPLVEPVQVVPLQQRLGCPVPFGVHVSPGAHCPRESQRQPWPPAIQGTPVVREAPAPPLDVLPPLELLELPPELPELPELPPSPELLAPPELVE